MGLIVSPTHRNLTLANGADRTGWMMVTWARALVAGGFWRRKYQGDGLSAYSTGTTDLFTANTNGYTTSGAWSAGVGGANSITNPKAYIVLEEVVSGSVTGRQAMMQRGSATGVGNDRLINMVFAWSPMTGSPAAATAPTAPAKSFTYGTVNAGGVNVWQRLATSPQLGGVGGTLALNFWVCDEPSGATGNVCPWAIEGYDSSADEIAFSVVYEALLEAPATCTHPCAAIFPIVNAGATWEMGQAKTDISAPHGQSAGTALMIIDPTDNTTAVVGAITRDSFSSLLWPNSSVAASPLADVDGKFVKMPAIVRKVTGGAFAGVCESLGGIPGATAVWPDTFHASIADAVEPPLLSWTHLTIPWEVGLARTGLASAANHTDVRRVRANAVVAGDPPALTDLDPNDGSTIDPDDAITIDFTSVEGLSEVGVFVTFTSGASQRTETAYAADGALAPYLVDDSTPGTLEVSRDPGWSGDFDLTIVFVDTKGQRTIATASYVLSASLPSSEASP